MHIYKHEWEQAIENNKTILNMDNLNIDAMTLDIFILLVFSSVHNESIEKFKDLRRSIDVNEPKNPELYVKIA